MSQTEGNSQGLITHVTWETQEGPPPPRVPLAPRGSRWGRCTITDLEDPLSAEKPQTHGSRGPGAGEGGLGGGKRCSPTPVRR